MTSPDPPRQFPAANEVLEVLESPPSLRQLAPDKVVLRKPGRGEAPAIASGGIHLKAGCKYQIQVIPQATGDRESIRQVSLGIDEHLHQVGPAGVERRGDGSREYLLLMGSRSLFSPLPRKAEATVLIDYSRWGIFPYPFSVILWPSWWNQIAWAITVSVPLWISLARQLCFPNGQLCSAAEMWHNLAASRGLVAASLAVSIGGACVVRLFGWGLQMVGWGGE
jgi:hypothetical protein